MRDGLKLEWVQGYLEKVTQGGVVEDWRRKGAVLRWGIDSRGWCCKLLASSSALSGWGSDRW